MNFDVLITQFNSHNEIGMVLCRKYNIKLCIIITSPYEKDDYLPEIYEELSSTCEVRMEEKNFLDINKIKDLLIEFQDKKLLINLTGGERITSLILLKEATKLNINSIYVDLINNKEFIFKDDISITEGDFQDLNINELIKLSGNNIYKDSDCLFSKPEIIEMSKIILKNLDSWEIYKYKLYNNNIFVHDFINPLHMNINTIYLDNNEKVILNKVLKYLTNNKSIIYSIKKDNIKVEFLNNYIKGFLFKSGTWLEVITKAAISQIKDIDDVKSGVEFLWGDNNNIKNELDVVAVKDCVMVCISCKDSSKYNEDDLNELVVYSNRIGGENVKRILVATKLPVKSSVILRAKELKVNLLIVKNSIEEIKEDILKILK